VPISVKTTRPITISWVVTNGTQQAVDMVARVLLAPGDRVAVESPGTGRHGG
jgi:DNA-binding transcriptional MocR family regulator